MKNKKKLRRIIIYYIVFTLLTVILCIGLIQRFNYNANAIENEEIIEEVSDYVKIKKEKQEEKYDINFKELKLKNKDMIAYLNVAGTNISYPVVKCDNNDFYLTHNFRKKQSRFGWIFADFRNNFDGLDKNIVIYGHNMKNGTMFSGLIQLLNKDWKQENNEKCITLVTEKEQNTYTIFSIYEIKSDEGLKTKFSKNSFIEYINTLKSKSKYDFGIKLNEKDEILTLSTCGRTNEYRVLIHAVKK